MMPSSGIYLFAFSMAITPGPNNLMIMASGLNHGWRKSVPHLAGINLGFSAMLILTGIGLTSIFERFPPLHATIRVVGILYLLYLAWLIAGTPTGHLQKSSAKPLSFLQAALFQWVNPKAWIIVMGVIATFTTPNGNLQLQMVVIAAVILSIGLPCNLVWLFGGVSLQRVLHRPGHQRAFNITMAILLVLSIAPAISQFVFP